MSQWEKIKIAAKNFSKEHKSTRNEMLKRISQLDKSKQQYIAYYNIEIKEKFKKSRCKKIFKFLFETSNLCSNWEEMLENDFHRSFYLFNKNDVCNFLMKSDKGIIKLSKIFADFNFLDTRGITNLKNELARNHSIDKKILYSFRCNGEPILAVDNVDINEDLISACTTEKLYLMLKEKNNQASVINELCKRVVENKAAKYESEILKTIHNRIIEQAQEKNASERVLLEAMHFLEKNDEKYKKAEIELLKRFDALFDKSKDTLISFLKLCKKYKFKKFSHESLTIIIKDNELVVKRLGAFFSFISDFIPVNFFELLFSDEMQYKQYKSLFMKLYNRRNLEIKNSENRIKPFENEGYIEFCMKYKALRDYFLDFGYLRMKDEDKFTFIVKYLKRADFEFYLNVLVKKDEKFRKYLYDYYYNGIKCMDKSGKYTFFMNVYKLSDINNEQVEEILKENLNGFNVKKLFETEIGILFIKESIKYIVAYLFLINRCSEILDEIFEVNQIPELNKILWEELIKEKHKFIKYHDRFFIKEDKILSVIISGAKEKLKLFEILKYGDGLYLEYAVKYVVSNYDVTLIMDLVLRLDEDDRNFLLECLYEKSLLNEYDLRILEINDETWCEKIYDNVFNTLDDKIYEFTRVKRPDLFFDYCIRHSALRKKYFLGVDKKNCTIEEGIRLNKILKHENLNDFTEIIEMNKEHNNTIYTMSVCSDPKIFEDKLSFIYLMTVIRPEDSIYYVAEYADEIFKPLSQYLDEKEKLFKPIDYILTQKDATDIPIFQKVTTILETHMKNKYIVYLIMDTILNTLKECSQAGKLVLLKNISASVITNDHTVNFINLLIPLLHDSNSQICSESKRLLNEIPLKTPEMVFLRSQLIQAVLNEMYVKSFLSAFKNQLFNHYICFNSLNLLIQVLVKYLSEYRNDILLIIQNLRFIAIYKDLILVYPIIFKNLCSFVIEHTYSVDEVCKTAASLMEYGDNIDWDIVLKNLHVGLRVNKFLVECLKQSQKNVVEKIFNMIIKKPEGNDEKLKVEPFFLAYAPELSIFEKYIPIFGPFLKELFLSSVIENQEIAFNAFKSLEVTEFLIYACIVGEWRTKLYCVELFEIKKSEDSRITAMLYILRNDGHSCVRKRAFEIWKSRISNTNVALKDAHVAVLDAVSYQIVTKAFHDAVILSLADLITKYDKYVRKYVEEKELLLKNDIEKTVINNCFNFENNLECLSVYKTLEFILMEAIKRGKCIDLALDFSKKYSSVGLFKLLVKNEKHKNTIIETISKDIDKYNLGVLMDDSELVLDLFKSTKRSFLIKFMASSDKIAIFKDLLKNEAENRNLCLEIARNMEPSEEFEKLLLNVNPIYSASLYSSIDNCKDFGNLKQLFERMFNTLSYDNIKPLIVKKYSLYLLDVTYKNIEEADFLVEILCSINTTRSLDRLAELIDFLDITNVLYLVCGYLLYNYLIYENRESTISSLNNVYRKYKKNLNMFEMLIRRCLEEN